MSDATQTSHFPVFSLAFREGGTSLLAGWLCHATKKQDRFCFLVNDHVKKRAVGSKHGNERSFLDYRTVNQPAIEIKRECGDGFSQQGNLPNRSGCHTVIAVAEQEKMLP